MATIPKVLPPLPRQRDLERNVPNAAAFGWLSAGWRDLKVKPGTSLLYGFSVYVVSVAVVGGLFAFALDYILFPAFAGFMVVGPLIAVGLYEKSRRISQGIPVTLTNMIFVRPSSGGQVLFMGALLGLLMLFWIRAAVILYALFYGLQPFPGLDDILPTLFGTPSGWALLVVGSLVGGLFASFSFAISVFAVPMLLDRQVDALTAMGTSMALVWQNLQVMLIWGAIVVALFVVGVATGLLGLIIVFPLLGHATWHAYQEMRP